MPPTIALAGDMPPLYTIKPERGPELQNLLERCDDYSRMNFGIPTGDADAQSQFIEGLQHVPPEHKHLMALDVDGTMTAAVDFLEGYPDATTGVIGLLVVAPDHRGHGLGAAILHAIASWLTTRGSHRLRLDCHVAENTAAVPLLHRLGFTEQSRQLIEVARGQTRTRVQWLAPLPLPTENPRPAAV
ncbi:GNAT family N-acetyltransferase [Streptomyces sp. NL15-2K]|uniref:GNAT family N-acetyltransferase n=1 Tax=Streptomyces sp. NL15-2K TaxID=376149 RepID=UPI000F580CCE|nr:MULTISPECIES: GNAT family N-acetyltransferase [Actinomycetes]WKX09534.1 GNAT family N-acetyltransferase [Kutzneria buriramensis]GCB48953.1 hypothetical protein SNL152K_6283 [Streptomyces sp. NL15-2K]